MSITVIIADDHAMVLEGIRLLLEKQRDIKVVGETRNGREAVRKSAQLKPDIVLMDIAMPELNGIEATRQIRELSPSSRIIILSMHASEEYVRQAFKAGARGYLLKESTGAELIDAVRAVSSGQHYASKKISDILINRYVSHRDEYPDGEILSRLSPREREILELVVEGKTSLEIAGIIFLSPKTVETYRSRLMSKLGVDNIPDLVKFAIKKGLAPLE